MLEIDKEVFTFLRLAMHVKDYGKEIRSSSTGCGAKLLLLRKRVGPEIKPTITFLTTRVRNTEEYYRMKLQRVLSYMVATIYSVKIHLNINNINIVH